MNQKFIPVRAVSATRRGAVWRIGFPDTPMHGEAMKLTTPAIESKQHVDAAQVSALVDAPMTPVMITGVAFPINGT